MLIVHWERFHMFQVCRTSHNSSYNQHRIRIFLNHSGCWMGSGMSQLPSLYAHHHRYLHQHPACSCAFNTLHWTKRISNTGVSSLSNICDRVKTFQYKLVMYLCCAFKVSQKHWLKESFWIIYFYQGKHVIIGYTFLIMRFYWKTIFVR